MNGTLKQKFLAFLEQKKPLGSINFASPNRFFQKTVVGCPCSQDIASDSIQSHGCRVQERKGNFTRTQTRTCRIVSDLRLPTHTLRAVVSPGRTLQLTLHYEGRETTASIPLNLVHRTTTRDTQRRFLPKYTLKTLFRLSRVLLDIQKCILSGAINLYLLGHPRGT